MGTTFSSSHLDEGGGKELVEYALRQEQIKLTEWHN